MLVYDVTDRESFNVSNLWLDEMNRFLRGQSPIFVLVGQKCESKERVVSEEEGKKFADENGLVFMESSAKANVRVDEAFNTVFYKILEKETLKNEALLSSKKKSNCSCF